MTQPPVRVLLVDDDEDDYLMFRDLVSQIPTTRYSIEWASSYEKGAEAVHRAGYDVCFFDYRLGGRTGLELLKESIAAGCTMPIILLTGYGEQEVDLEAMRVGASDYLIKDQVSAPLIERSIRYSIHRSKSLEAIKEREAQILMQDRLASIGLLASSLAHEIGTPLGVIRGRAEYVALQLEGNAQVRKNVEIILSQIDRVSGLIRSLLNLARGDASLAAGEVDLSRVLGEVLDLMGHEFRKHDVEVRNEVPAGIARVHAEAGPLHQVLLNLLVNSAHAIDAAARAGRADSHGVRITATDRETHWEVRIQDTGCGISAANMRNLFKPFFTTKDVGFGTGLGLATSYRILESWGGSISAESAEGSGSTFKVLLPKAKGPSHKFPS